MTNLVPVQITVPAQQAGGVPKAITIHVPSNALANGVAGLQLQAILSSPTAAQTFALEVCMHWLFINRFTYFSWDKPSCIVENGFNLHCISCIGKGKDNCAFQQ